MCAGRSREAEGAVAAAAMLLCRRPSAGRGNAPGPAEGLGAGAGLGWGGLSAGRVGLARRRAEQRSRPGRSGVRADAGLERARRAGTPWLPLAGASVRPRAGGQC